MTEKFIDRKIFGFCRLRPDNLSVTKFFGQITCLSHKAFRIAISCKISRKLILDVVMRMATSQPELHPIETRLVCAATLDSATYHRPFDRLVGLIRGTRRFELITTNEGYGRLAAEAKIIASQTS